MFSNWANLIFIFFNLEGVKILELLKLHFEKGKKKKFNLNKYKK
jgi:hypothetical protein